MEIGLSVPREHPYHSTTLYNGKLLQPLPAVDQQRLKFIEYGAWSDVMPEQLRRIIQKPERYKEAIRIINTVSQNQGTGLHRLCNFNTYWSLFAMSLGLTIMNTLVFVGIPFVVDRMWLNIRDPEVISLLVCVPLVTFVFTPITLMNLKNDLIIAKMLKVISQANVHLFEEKILMGAHENSRLEVVYVSLDGCKRELCGLSHGDELFKKYISEYSGWYIYCLAQRQFPFKAISQTGHLDGALCFCQYVIRRLSIKRCCYCCKEQYVYSPPMAYV